MEKIKWRGKDRGNDKAENVCHTKTMSEIFIWVWEIIINRQENWKRNEKRKRVWREREEATLKKIFLKRLNSYFAFDGTLQD